MNKMKDEAFNLIEDMTLNNFQWSTERGQPKRVRGKLEVDALTLLAAKVDAMTQRLDRMNVLSQKSCMVSIIILIILYILLRLIYFILYIFQVRH